MINFIEMNVEFPPHFFFHFDQTNEIGIYNKNIYIQVTPWKITELGTTYFTVMIWNTLYLVAYLVLKKNQQDIFIK